ncbi:MAG: hypothetical protein ACLTBV_25265 [Enterocloster bolteae]
MRWTEKLPPIHVLADELGISINTARNAQLAGWSSRSWQVTRASILATIVQTESMDKKKLEEELVTSIKNAALVISFLWTRYGALWTRS